MYIWKYFWKIKKNKVKRCDIVVLKTTFYYAIKSHAWLTGFVLYTWIYHLRVFWVQILLVLSFFFLFFFGTILFLNNYVDITLCWTIELDCLNLSLLISAICKIFSNLTASILWYTIRGLSQNCVNWGLNLNSVCCDHFMIDQNIQTRAYMYNIRLEKNWNNLYQRVLPSGAMCDVQKPAFPSFLNP